MLSRLKIKLKSDTLNSFHSSCMQGVLFESIDSDYISFLHMQNLHPYSQYLCRENGGAVWYINTLNDESFEKLILPLLSESFDCIKVKHISEEKIDIIDKQLTQIDRKNLLNEFYSDEHIKQINIKFKTPSSFKQNGIYNVVPDLRLIYQSLMMKYSASSDQINMTDKDALDEMIKDSFVSGYSLKTTSFPVEHVTIPGFIGNMTIRFRNNDTISRYIRLLLRFGEFSGIGVKTGMGMGAFEIVGSAKDG